MAGSPHAIGQGTLVANSNYTIAFTPSVLMVTPAPLTITAEEGQGLRRHGSAPDVSFERIQIQRHGGVRADRCTAASGGRSGGGRTLSGDRAGTLAANTNYTIAFTGASPPITPATLTVTAEAKSKEYGEANPPLTYLSSGHAQRYRDVCADW